MYFMCYFSWLEDVARWKANEESNIVQTALLTKKQASDKIGNLHSEKRHLDNKGSTEKVCTYMHARVL